MSDIDAEEGEIIDDDFEDISDNSIILNETGKSLSSKDPLPVISLSSVSETEEDSIKMLKIKMKRFKRYGHHHHHHRRHKGRRKIKDKCYKKKKWKRLMSSSSSNDSESSFDIELDRKLQNQLKAAIRVQNTDDGQKNSLKSRLRAMTKSDIGEIKKNDDNDDELIQLRLEALKTAVLNKLEHRKKRKLDNDIKINNLDINKENSNENIQKKPCLDMDEDEDVLRALLLASMSKKITNEQKIEPKQIPQINKKIPLKCIPPKIKPIIININTDSDTDDDKIKITDNKNAEIENSVEKFLKEQRAKVEAQMPISKPDNSLMEKSAVKLLPKFKQIEYHKLLLRLKNAQKKPKVRKVSFKSDDKKIVRNKVSSPDKVSGMDKVPDIKHDARILHCALKEMQKEKNGRLQIEEKYIVLTPIIRKINEATTERKKYDQEVKRLLDELARAKEKLHITHCNFSSNVTELLKKKEEIDNNLVKQKLPCTSTPNKIISPIEFLNTSIVPNTSELSHEENKKTFLLKISEMDAVCNENNIDLDDINPGDPNDIHRIYQQGVPKYISPLDYIKRDISDDPFVIMCPYDIDGNCRDSECTYKHYSR